MITYEYILGSKTFNICNSAPFEVVEIDGIDLAAVKPVVEQGPLQDGDTDKDMRLEARIIQMIVQARTTPTYDHETNRELFNSIFRPSKMLGALRLTYTNGKVYQIAARCLGNTGIKRSRVDDQLLKAGVSFRCPDPLWYNPVLKSESFGLSGGGGAFTVPTPVPTFIGTSTLNQTKQINYAGTYKYYPLLQLYGPITNARIDHLGTGKKIDFNGFTINNGDYYTIDLRYGRKFIYKNGVLTDIRTGEVTTDSQLATFALDTDPVVVDGINAIKVTGSAVNTATQVYIQYYDAFAGI